MPVWCCTGMCGDSSCDLCVCGCAVVSWGESHHGALGLDKGVTMLTKPTVIPALVGKRVRHTHASLALV